MNALDSTRFRSVFAAFTLFTLLAGDAWRYSLSWYGFGVIAVGMTVVSAMLLVRNRARASLPYPLVAFMALATVSILWSFYPGATALGLLVTWMTVIIGAGLAVAYSWPELLKALGTALRIILALSLAFELFVSVFIRMPVLPFWSPYEPSADLPKLLYWSRNLLFEGGKIQGIVGNSSLLAFVALLAVVVFGVQWASGRIRRASGISWLAVAGITILLTRSATITVALVVLAAAVGAVLLVRRTKTARARATVLWSLGGVVVAGITAGIVFRNTLLGLLGKSDDLTGRLDIWNAVIGLAQQRPAFGWGWVSYWVPWVAPFDNLVFKGGVRQLHAHNAWLDVWLQLGILGLIVFGALVLSTTMRAWLFAIDREQHQPGVAARFTVETMLPLLIITALIVQSLAESRLLVEYGLALLVIVAIKTKTPDVAA